MDLKDKIPVVKIESYVLYWPDIYLVSWVAKQKLCHSWWMIDYVDGEIHIRSELFGKKSKLRVL